jgi:hypothetical protein
MLDVASQLWDWFMNNITQQQLQAVPSEAIIRKRWCSKVTLRVMATNIQFDGCVYYEGESVNRSQMDIKRKACDIRILPPPKKTFISRHILHQHWYTYPIALPVRRNLQHTNLLTVVSDISAHPFQPLRHQRNICHPVVNCFTRQTLPTVNRKYFFGIMVRIGSFCPQNGITERCSSVAQS